MTIVIPEVIVWVFVVLLVADAALRCVELYYKYQIARLTEKGERP